MGATEHEELEETAKAMEAAGNALVKMAARCRAASSVAELAQDPEMLAAVAQLDSVDTALSRLV